MIRSITQAKLLTILAATICLLSEGQTKPDPTAAEILKSARITQMTREATLQGELRVNQNRIPFAVALSDGLVRYRFVDPDYEIHLRFNEAEPEIAEIKPGESRPTPVNPGTRLRDSTITLEDLSLPFLYWPNPKLLGSDMIRTRQAWKIEVQAPRGKSQYGVARLWVDKQTGALLKIEGFDYQGHLSKRFEVIAVQKIEDQWMLRTMRVEEFAPETRKVVQRTYLDIKK